MNGWETNTIFGKTTRQNFDFMTENFRYGHYQTIHSDIKPYLYSTLHMCKTQFEFQITTDENLSRAIITPEDLNRYFYKTI